MKGKIIWMKWYLKWRKDPFRLDPLSIYGKEENALNSHC